jgi:hypothetical protein
MIDWSSFAIGAIVGIAALLTLQAVLRMSRWPDEDSINVHTRDRQIEFKDHER